MARNETRAERLEYLRKKEKEISKQVNEGLSPVLGDSMARLAGIIPGDKKEERPKKRI